jgi:predicted RNA-binding protein with PUA-like domain
MATGYWLMKSEPDTFGIHDLERVRVEPWTGVRNFTARNFMRDEMQVGDAVLFYHSSVDPPGVAGLAKVVRTGVVDETQFDPASPYHDPTAKRDAPRWICVDVEYVATLPRLVALDELRANPALADMLVLRRGMRLSIQPVTAADYKAIVAMAGKKPKAAPKPAAPPVRTGSKAPPSRPARRPPGRAPAKTRAR